MTGSIHKVKSRLDFVQPPQLSVKQPLGKKPENPAFRRRRPLRSRGLANLAVPIAQILVPDRANLAEVVPAPGRST